MENLKIYTELSKINCNEHVEKKNGLNYLSWAWAIDTMEKFCDEHSLELDYGVDDLGNDGLVHTHVSINGKSKSMWLPIMDFKNKSIPNPSTTDINKAYMRCLTKNFAMWGLGMYIYAGEDLPESEGETKVEKPQVEKISKEQWRLLNLAYTKEQIKEFYKELGITNGQDIPADYARQKLDEDLSKTKEQFPDKQFF